MRLGAASAGMRAGGGGGCAKPEGEAAPTAARLPSPRRRGARPAPAHLGAGTPARRRGDTSRRRRQSPPEDREWPRVGPGCAAGAGPALPAAPLPPSLLTLSLRFPSRDIPPSPHPILAVHPIPCVPTPVTAARRAPSAPRVGETRADKKALPGPRFIKGSKSPAFRSPLSKRVGFFFAGKNICDKA